MVADFEEKVTHLNPSLSITSTLMSGVTMSSTSVILIHTDQFQFRAVKIADIGREIYKKGYCSTFVMGTANLFSTLGLVVPLWLEISRLLKSGSYVHKNDFVS